MILLWLHYKQHNISINLENYGKYYKIHMKMLIFPITSTFYTFNPTSIMDQSLFTNNKTSGKM